jgi:hypothetical protein
VKLTIKSILRTLATCACLAHASVALAVCSANLGISATPTADFVNHGDGTVTHSPTGLMWKHCTEGLSGPTCSGGSALSLYWSPALSAATASTFAGYTDWRLPNKKELESLVDDTCANPAINEAVFPGTPLDSAWTSSTHEGYSTDGFAIWFANGASVALNKQNSQRVLRLVRNGQSFDAEAVVPPAARITSGPADGYETSASFTFTSSGNQGAVGYLCDLDRAGLRACTSPISYTGLLPGRHTFVLLAYDPVFNFDPNPPTFTWNVLPRPVPTVAPVLLALLSMLVALIAVSRRARLNAAKL